jgi:hypothetical protein
MGCFQVAKFCWPVPARTTACATRRRASGQDEAAIAVKTHAVLPRDFFLAFNLAFVIQLPAKPNYTTMKKYLLVLAAVIAGSTLSTTHAQPGMRGGMGGPPPGPRLGGDMAKIFGENSAFSATLEMHTTGGPAADGMTMPGKLANLEGKSRFEMDMTQMKSSRMPPQASEQMKQMGMDKMVAIARPDKKLSYLVYPGMQAYVENPLQDPDAAKPESDFKIDTTELGKDTVDGHECVKNKVVVTDKEGKTHESTVWNATDLKKFPVKVETTENGMTVTMQFKDVKLAKPDAGQFDPPSGFKKYDSMMAMMQQEMMKRMGGGAGMPPGQQ